MLLENYINSETPPQIADVKLAYLNSIADALKDYFQDKPAFDISNFELFFTDEYATNTSITNKQFANLQIIIDNTKNLKNIIYDKQNKIKDLDCYLDLSSIRKQFFELLTNYFDENSYLWVEHDYICTSFSVPEIKDFTFYFKINLWFSDESNGGISVGKSSIKKIFPVQYLENFKNKNQETNDVYRQVILFYKNVYSKENKVLVLPYEIFETLLYNVPNNMFTDFDKNCISRVTSYLANVSFKNLKTIDEQSGMFSLYTSYSIFYCKNILRTISKFIKNNF